MYEAHDGKRRVEGGVYHFFRAMVDIPCVPYGYNWP